MSAWISGAFEYRRAILATEDCFAYWPVVGSSRVSPSLVAGAPDMALVGSGVLENEGDTLVHDDGRSPLFSIDNEQNVARALDVQAPLDYSCELWVKATTIAQSFIFVIHRDKGLRIFLSRSLVGDVPVHTVRVRSQRSDNTAIDAPTHAARYKEHELLHLAATRTAAGLIVLYVNGEEASRITDPTPNYSTAANNVLLGSHLDSTLTPQSLNGSLSHASLYSRALTAREFRWHYRVGANLETLPTDGTISELVAIDPASTASGSITLPSSGATVRLDVAMRDGVITGDPMLKYMLLQTGLMEFNE